MEKSESKDIWRLALEEAGCIELEKKASEEEVKGLEKQADDDTNVLFIGSQNAGKTTIILRFLDREEPPKPTVALEYTYGRKSRGNNMAKDVAHLWELGGGTFLSKLVEIPISKDTIRSLSIVMVLDLSKPNQLWNTLEVYIREIRQSINNVLSELRSQDSSLADYLRKKSWKKFGEDHPDKDLLNPCPIPLAIIGSKYDIFRDFDPEKKKIISKTLRFIAHTNGASLYFFSMKTDPLVTRVKQVVSNLAFGTGISNTMSMDHTKPLVVPAGADALGQIGIPSLSSGDVEQVNAKNPLELWKQAYCGYFPQDSSQPEVADDPCKDSKYKELAVDTMRLQKDEDLERYRRECEKKVRDSARQKGQKGQKGQTS